MLNHHDIKFEINGKQVATTAAPMSRLLDVIRALGYTGTKEGCGEGECGACSVILNGDLVNSCLVPLAQVQNARVRTVEGLEQNARLSKLQECFIKAGGAQCGICTPGMLVAAQHLLAHNPKPSAEDIRQGLAGNLCRCTGFTKIFDAVAEAAATEVEE